MAGWPAAEKPLTKSRARPRHPDLVQPCLETGRHGVVAHRHGEQVGADAEEFVDELVLDRGGPGLLRGCAESARSSARRHRPQSDGARTRPPGAASSTCRFSPTPTDNIDNGSSRRERMERRRSQLFRFPRIQSASRIPCRTSHRNHIQRGSTATDWGIRAGERAFALLTPRAGPNQRAADSSRSGKVDDPTGQK